MRGFLRLAPLAGNSSPRYCFHVPRIRHLSVVTAHSEQSKKAGFRFGAVAAALSLGALGYGLGSAYPPKVVSLLFPHPSPPPLAPTSPEGLAHISSIESQLQNLPHVDRLRENEAYYETRPFANYPEEKRIHSLTSGALRGPGKLAVPPILFARHDDSEAIAFVHLGNSLCGHEGIIHGGLIATLLDESLARTAILNLPSKIGVTANLSVNYRAPTMAGQFVKITTVLKEQKGRKAVVTARVEDLQGVLLAEGLATFVEPKYAKMLSSSAVTAALGKPNGKIVKVPVPQDASI